MKKGKAAMANVRQIQVAKLKYYNAGPMFDFVETVNHVYVYTEYKFSVTRERVEYFEKDHKSEEPVVE